MSEELILKLVGLIENASPILWGIALKQVAVDLAMSQVALWLSVAICVLAVILSIRYGKEVDWDSYDTRPNDWVFVLWACVSIISLLIALFNLKPVISMSINPEYHAIKLLLSLVGN